MSFANLLRLAALALLLGFLLSPQSFEPLFAPLTHYGAPPIYDQGNLFSLALAQLGTVPAPKIAGNCLGASNVGDQCDGADGASYFFRARSSESSS